MKPAEARTLGQRWLSAGGGWAVGMRVLAEPDAEPLPDDTGPPINTVIAVESELVTVAWSTWAGSAEGGTLLRDDVPDVTDAATVGAMLGIVRERWGGDVWTQGMICYPPGDGPVPTRTGLALRWVVGGLCVADGLRLNGAGPDGFDTEAEALISAMEDRK